MRLSRITMRPNDSREVQIAGALDPRTSPGTYAFQLQLGEASHPVEAHVIEVVDLEISPDERFIEGAPGDKITKTVVLRNAGNVPLAIGEIGAVQLDSEELHCRAQRAALKALDDDTETFDQIMAAMSRSGSGTEMASTKSHSPLWATASMASVVIWRKTVSSFFTMRGVKPRLMRLRSRPWRGSPSSMSPIFAGFPGRTPCSEVKSSWCFDT